MSNYLVIVECAIEHEGKYLMIRRPEGVQAGGLLAFPGGKVDYADGEKCSDILINAVKREVYEEVGLNLLDPIRFATSSYFIYSSDQHALDVIFYTKLEKTKVEVTPSAREVPEYFWLTLEQIHSHKKTPEWVERQIAIIEREKRPAGSLLYN
jgi:8-oxo-dGTP diphosphatase